MNEIEQVQNISNSNFRRWLIFLACALVGLTNEVGNGVLNLGIAPIREDLSLSQTDAQGILTVGKLIFGAFILAGGVLGDLYGRRRVLVLGAVGVVAASLIAATAQSSGMLLAARFLDGMANAAIGPLAIAILVRAFPPEQQAKIVGLFLGITGLGVALGPLSVGIIQLNNGFSLKLLVSFVIGVASLAFFVWWERRVANPLLDIRLFSNRTFPSALLAGFTIGLIIGGSLLPLLYFIQKIQEISLVAAFVRILPMVVAAVLFSPVAGTLVEKRGARQIIVFGLGLVAISGMIFSFMQPATPYAIILLALILLGIGNIAIVTPVTDTVLNCLPPEKSGSAAAINFDLRAVVHALAFKPFLILCESSFRKPPSMRLP